MGESPRICPGLTESEPIPVKPWQKIQLVHQVSDWGSGVAIKMGRRQGGPSRTGHRKEHIWIDT